MTALVPAAVSKLDSSFDLPWKQRNAEKKQAGRSVGGLRRNDDDEDDEDFDIVRQGGEASTLEHANIVEEQGLLKSSGISSMSVEENYGRQIGGC